MARTRNPFRMVRDALYSIKGNARACVFLEPLFAIPHTLYAGYMTLYMLEMGMTKEQVGMLTSLGLALNIFFSLISASVTDKLGRRKATMIFESIGWGLAQLVWAVALNIHFFIVAAVVNSFVRIATNSWSCLMVEDSTPGARVHIYNFLQIASILAGFFAPVGALLVNRLTLVPAMRVMLFSSVIIMTVLFIARYKMVKETDIGLQKMREMEGVSIFKGLKHYIPALRHIFENRLLMIVLLVRALNYIQITIRSTFLAVLVTEGLGFPAESMAVFHTLNAVVMLFVLLFITPLLAQFTRRWPIALGIWFHVAATVVLLLSPAGQNYPLLILSAVLIALGTSIAEPRISALVANTVRDEERSTVNAMVSVVLLLISMPFGYIGGVLSGIDSRLPFLMTFVIFLMSLLLLRVATAMERRHSNANLAA